MSRLRNLARDPVARTGALQIVKTVVAAVAAWVVEAQPVPLDACRDREAVAPEVRERTRRPMPSTR